MEDPPPVKGTELHVYPDVERDFNLNGPLLVGQGTLTGIGLLRHGTVEGAATVSMLVELRDGGQVFAQTTWALFDAAAKTLAASPIAAEEVP